MTFSQRVQIQAASALLRTTQIQVCALHFVLARDAERAVGSPPWRPDHAPARVDACSRGASRRHCLHVSSKMRAAMPARRARQRRPTLARSPRERLPQLASPIRYPPSSKPGATRRAGSGSVRGRHRCFHSATRWGAVPGTRRR
eukprot:CAMPEP_0173068478 /NCGR_PEP_ID=MMETSP1102-20130122/7435_1 /TAXON_ID=49646 /ORGANISM="Geminigera sp., Strain Caron Lab Isolate" /LENGTH=143 /DNA_ID=CAMNT_0013936343 /DNA_START=780 /DNA_END=1212 /DNA_ORIENTATION=-